MKHLPVVLAFSVALIVSCVAGFAEDKAPATSATRAAMHDTVGELVSKGFNTFTAALTKTDYLDKVASGTYTVLAPTDVAFRDLPKAQLDALLADKEKLTAMISNHLIEGKVSSSELKSGNVKTVAGTTIKAKVVDGKLKVGTATVVKLDVPSTNGVIHGIDAFLDSK